MTTKAKADELVRVKYSKDPKRARFERITIDGVGSFTRGGDEVSQPLRREVAEGLKNKGFDIVTEKTPEKESSSA